MTKLTTETNVNPMALFRAFSSGLSRRDILFMFSREDLQQLVEHFGWSGRVFNDSGCKGVSEENCLFDPIALVEANLSVSKVNYFIKHTGLREISIAPNGGVSERVSLSIRNTVNLTADPNARGIGGSYRTYLRFIVPIDSSINGVTLDGITVLSRDSKSTKLPQLPYIEKLRVLPGHSPLVLRLMSHPDARRRYKFCTTGGRNTVWPWWRTIGSFVVQASGYKRYRSLDHCPVSGFWVATDESGGAGLVAKDGELQYNTTILQDQLTRIKIYQMKKIHARRTETNHRRTKSKIITEEGFTPGNRIRK